MKAGPHDIAVCSWSLKPADTRALIDQVKQLGLDHVQLAAGPYVQLDDKRKHFELGLIRESGLAITATMIGFPGEDYSTIAAIRQTGGYVSDDQWPLRQQITRAAAQFTKELGVSKLSAHAGFIPPSSDPKYQTMLQRINEIAEELSAMGMDFVLETGQESATELLQFLNDLRARNVHVNFDPANMILYGAGDPIEAIGVLGRHIVHVHVKDATISNKPGTEWGEEVPFGTGQVPPGDFLAALARAGYTGPLAIEREAGDNRMADVATAIKALRAAAS